MILGTFLPPHLGHVYLGDFARRYVEELKEKGISILLVEQNAAASLAISDRGYVLEMGRVVLSGPANALMQNREIKSAYLGSVKT